MDIHKALTSCNSKLNINNLKLKFMKKILTLMTALSAVAGSAMANDFNFEVNGNPTVDEKGNVTGTNGNLQLKDNKFTFEVNNGDEVTLTSTGKVTVKLGETVLKANKEGVYSVTSDGVLTVELAKGAAVTKIVVVSSNSQAVQNEIDNAYNEMGKAIQAVAKYVNYNGFYTNVQAIISKAGEKVQAVKAELAEKKAVNGVTDEVKDELIAKLNSVTKLSEEYGYGAVKDAKDVVAKAEEIYELYTEITVDEANKANKKLDHANGTATVAEWNENKGEEINKKPLFTHDFTAAKDKNGNITKINLGDYKRAWLKGEWDNLNKEVNETIKNKALDELNNFPNSFVTNDKEYFVQLYTEVGEKLENVISRAIFERDNFKAVEDLSIKVEKVDAALKEGKPFVLDQVGKEYTLEDYTLLKAQIVSMQNEINQSDNRYMYDAENYTEFVDNIAGVSAKLDVFYTKLVGKAKDDLNIKLEKSQDTLTKYAYEVSAKYENEPALKKDAQEEFSKHQNNLDKIKEDFKACKFYTVQTDYAGFVDRINTLNDSVKTTWNNTLDVQKQQIIKNNVAAQTVINDSIENVRKDYNDYVGWIQTWMTLDATKSVADKLKAHLNTLFDEINGLDDMKVKVQALVDEKLENIKKESDDEFGAHYEANKNLYRITEDVVAGYMKQVGKVGEGIYEELVAAAIEANAAANTYLTAKDVADTRAIITTAKTKVVIGDNNKTMSDAAFKKFNNAYTSVENKYIEAAEKEIERLAAFTGKEPDFKENILANNVEAIRETLAKVEPAVTEVNGNLTEYKALYKSIYNRKVEWNYAKSQETDLENAVKDWEKENNSESHFDVKKALTDANEMLAGQKEKGKKNSILTDLEENCLVAEQKKDDFTTRLKAYDDEMYKIQHYGDFKANEAAAPIVSAKVTDVTTVIADARETIKAYEAEIKDEASASLDKVADDFDNLKKSINTAVENKTIGANKESFIASLNALADRVDVILKKAADDANGAKIDLNGDGTIDSKDFKVATDNFKLSLDSKVFNTFMSKYAEFKKKH